LAARKSSNAGERLEQVEQNAVAVDRLGDLRDDRLLLREVDRRIAKLTGEEGDADEQRRQQAGHHGQGGRRVLRLGRLERRYPRRDRLRAGQGDGAGGECPEDQQDAERLGGGLTTGWRSSGHTSRPPEDDDPEGPDHDHDQRRPDEQVGRCGEDVARLAQAAQVRDGDQADRGDADQDPLVEQDRKAETICSTADDVETATVMT
jgi:hypothetical protein